eukprot:COSAG06_NODE_54853_length_292_cov_1.077720_1_plen_44_part_01
MDIMPFESRTHCVRRERSAVAISWADRGVPHRQLLCNARADTQF